MRRERSSWPSLTKSKASPGGIPKSPRPEAVTLRDFCVAHTKTQAMFRRATSVFTIVTRAVGHEGAANVPVVPSDSLPSHPTRAGMKSQLKPAHRPHVFDVSIPAFWGVAKPSPVRAAELAGGKRRTI